MTTRSRSRRGRTGGNASPTTRGHARLEGQLSLLAWLHHKLGYETTSDLLREIKPTNEGFREDGRSHICAHMESRSEHMQGLTIQDLQSYDDNIRQHLAAMNVSRPEPITLRYFQYLAALYTEIYLDWYFNRPGGLLPSLNALVLQHNSNCTPDQRWDQFTAEDLTKLAFWMATGGGKTLLLHLHYRQFMHYNRDPLDNILLITPNEGLSQQHIEELRASNIPAARFDVNEVGSLRSPSGIVRVTEITKLVMNKRGEGESIPVEALEGRNLIFVDEGHKGSGSEAQAWRTVRSALARKGFTFEYSATFGQAVAAAKSDVLLTEYGKAIAFDYSYRHFYNDGYGKDFSILNLQQDTSPNQTDVLLMANLLSFYEQQLVFAAQEQALRPYNLSKPLWAFVGSTVNKSDSRRSDILLVVRFLHRVLNERGWATEMVDQLLNGQSGLRSPSDNQDIFLGKFAFLRIRGRDAAAVYADALSKVMHASAGGGLLLADLRGADGELGLIADGSDAYFGVINIGDTAEFKRLVESDGSGVAIVEDALHGSLFDRINEPDSTVEVLAGARKFIEGWNSWRVSNMGLLNIGHSEGSQIIQLFGRGVRLRGRDMSLKRSSALNDGPHPDHIRLLETLNIFALRANYMVQFRNYLESEGICTQEVVDLPLFIQPNRDFLNKGLVIPRLDQGEVFSGQETVLLEHDADVAPVSVVMSATAQRIESARGRLATSGASSGVLQRIPLESLDLVDWNSAYLELLEYKDTKGFSNLLVRPGLLRPILEAGDAVYLLEAEEPVVRPKNHEDRQRLQEAVINILRRYADRLYRRRQSQWESRNLTYRQLDDSDENFRFNMVRDGGAGQYIVRVPRDKTNLVQAIEQLLEDCNDLYREDQGDLPRIHFDRHLYQPLLVEDEGVTSSPPGLQDSERQFVADLKNYCASEPNALPDGAELFLLRNLTRGKGVGFFDSSGFYPDFILWVKGKDGQRIVFMDPHGMRQERAYIHDDRARLHERLPELSKEIANRSGNPNVQLDSFIVSATKYEDLWRHYGDGTWTRDDFAAKHILFQEPGQTPDYIEQILRG